jgi:hypothetical protein
VGQAGTECQDELEAIYLCWKDDYLPQATGCGLIFGEMLCGDKQFAYNECLATYECRDHGCHDLTDPGGPMFCSCLKTCELVDYRQRCTWNGSAFDCNCLKGDVVLGTCQIQGDPVCSTIETSYCCGPYFNL